MRQRLAYFVLPSITNEAGEFIPCIATEDEPGYVKTDWHWGLDLEMAEKLAASMNLNAGQDEEAVAEITASMMRAQNNQDNLQGSENVN